MGRLDDNLSIVNMSAVVGHDGGVVVSGEDR
jgi:hypothetical protein